MSILSNKEYFFYISNSNHGHNVTSKIVFVCTHSHIRKTFNKDKNSLKYISEYYSSTTYNNEEISV